MKEMKRKFKLSEEQIVFLKEKYPREPIVQKILSVENNGYFVVDVDTKIDFMDFVENESVYWMNEHQEATSRTYMLESIRDDIYYQTN